MDQGKRCLNKLGNQEMKSPENINVLDYTKDTPTYVNETCLQRLVDSLCTGKWKNYLDIPNKAVYEAMMIFLTDGMLAHVQYNAYLNDCRVLG